MSTPRRVGSPSPGSRDSRGSPWTEKIKVFSPNKPSNLLKTKGSRLFSEEMNPTTGKHRVFREIEDPGTKKMPDDRPAGQCPAHFSCSYSEAELIAEAADFFPRFIGLSTRRRGLRRRLDPAQHVHRHEPGLDRLFLQHNFAIQLRHARVLAGLLRHLRVALANLLFARRLRNALVVEIGNAAVF